MLILIILFSLSAILFLPDAYIIFSVLKHASLVWRVAVFVPTVITILSIVYMFYGLRVGVVPRWMVTVSLVGLLGIALPKLLFTIISLLVKLVAICHAPLFVWGNYVAVAVSAVFSLMMLYGIFVEWKRFVVKEVEISLSQLPAAFDGYRIVQLSDLHLGTHGDDVRFIEGVVKRVNALQPDLIVFTGDLVNSLSNEVNPYTNALAQLEAKDGVLAVLGNHDYCIYGPERRADNIRLGAAGVVAAEKEMGWTVLRNECRFVERGADSLAIIGVENTGKPPFPHIGNLPAAMKAAVGTKCKILLSHDPSHWRMEVLAKTDIALTLSGHTHAAQFKLFGWSPSRWLYKEWSGLYAESNQYLYVSEGTGGTLPFRLGTPPQITLLTLHKAD